MGQYLLPDFTFRSSAIYTPLTYPDLGNSVYVGHKEIPREIPPESAIPTSFTKAADSPSSKEAKQLEDTLAPLNSVNQTGHGKDQVELALSKPVKV